jgi:predicted Na+-dependent transporter
MAVNYRPIVGNIFLFFLIFGLSATVNIKNFQAQTKNYRAIGTGLLLQFIILPFIGFLVVKVADFDPVIGITLLIITASPGGAYSNWFCSIFNGDLALSVSMTAISTIMSLFMLPFNVFVYSRLTYSNDVLGTLDWSSLGISLLVVVASISLGIYVSYKYGSGPSGKRIHDVSNKLGNVAGLGLILFTSLAPEGGRISLVGKEPIFYYGTIMPIVLGLISSVAISTVTKLKKPERVTVSVECVYQNTSIAMTSCLALFSGDDQQRALAVPFWYTGMQTSFVGCYCLLAWKMGWTKAPADANILHMVLHNYQGDLDDDNAEENKNETNEEGTNEINENDEEKTKNEIKN